MARAGIDPRKAALHIIILLVAISAFFSASCRTTQEYEGYIPSLDEATIIRLENLLEENNFLQVLQDIDTLLRDNVSKDDSVQKLTAIENTALETLQQKLGENIDQGRFIEALKLYRSLQAYGDTPLDETVTEQSLLISAALQDVESGNNTAGIMLFLKAAEMGTVPLDVIYRFGSVALEEYNGRALRKITEMLEAGGEEIPDSYKELLAVETKTADMIAGTVTIWVNRGIKLEAGVGYPERVIGSGFFIDRSGYIVTNYHVISSEVDPEYEGYSRLYVRLPNDPSTRIPAVVVGWNRVFDIALLKAELEPEYIFMFERGVTTVPGDAIYAIGSPAGLESTITSGIVSAKDRELLQMGNALQVDVPINQGNSGGPLLNKEGKLIGVVFAGIEQFEGVNFAIPAEWLIELVPDLFREGKVELPWIGAMAVKDDEGLEIMYIVPGSPAQRAGLSEGDIITKIADRDVSLLSDAHKEMLELSADMLAEIHWKRDGSEMRGLLKLGRRPFRPLETAIERDVQENLLVPLFGMKVEKTGKTGFEQNYIVTRVYSGFSADETGLSPNDPFSIRDWIVEEEEGYAAVQIRVKKRKAGFIESVIQIAAYLENANFI